MSSYLFIRFVKSDFIIYHLHKWWMTVLLYYFRFPLRRLCRIGFKVYLHVCIRLLSISDFGESSGVIDHDAQSATSVMKRQLDLTALYVVSDSLLGPPISNYFTKMTSSVIIVISYIMNFIIKFKHSQLKIGQVLNDYFH